MYRIVMHTKNIDVQCYDYFFEKINLLDEIANVVTVPFGSSFYSIGVYVDKYSDLETILKNSSKYEHLMLDIIASKSALKIAVERSAISYTKGNSSYDIFKEIIAKYGLVFDRGLIYILYSSIDHDPKEMEATIKMLADKFKHKNMITQKDLSSIMVLNDMVYPHTVLASFIREDRYRWNKFNKCVEHISKDIVYYSIRKNLKTLVKNKGLYLQSGTADRNIVECNTYNLEELYIWFFKTKIKDAELIFRLYDKKENMIYDYI